MALYHILPIWVKTNIPTQWSLFHFYKITAFIPPHQNSRCLDWTNTSSNVFFDFPHLPRSRTSSLSHISISSTSCPYRLGNNFQKFPEVDWWQDMGVWSLNCLTRARMRCWQRSNEGASLILHSLSPVSALIWGWPSVGLRSYFSNILIFKCFVHYP